MAEVSLERSETEESSYRTGLLVNATEDLKCAVSPVPSTQRYPGGCARPDPGAAQDQGQNVSL